MYTKDLIMVTAYCQTEEQEIALEKCIDSVVNTGMHIALISHSHIPIHIQKKCHYYVYDYLNDISDDPRLLGLRYYLFSDKRIQSIFFDKYFYGFSIYRMFSMGSQIAINFGYKNIHHIEYDCLVLDNDLLKEHSELLENYDSVIYTNTGDADGFLYAHLKSFKTSSLPDQFKNYNKDYMEKEIIEHQPCQLEIFTKRLFINSGNNILFKNKSELSGRFTGSKPFYNRNIHHTIFYNDEDKTLNIFYESNRDEKITIIVNEHKVINLDVQSNYWHVKPLGTFDDINHIRIDNSVKILYQKTFDQNEREIYKNKSFLSEEENN